MASVVCFGEVMLRLATPTGQRLQQLPALTPIFGGSEANVAAALTQLGHRAQLVSVLPDNALGQGCESYLRALGVNLDHCRRGGGRMGVYFLERGAGPRPSAVLYDRAGSAFAEDSFQSLDWEAILTGADALHLSGITLALSTSARQAVAVAAKAARHAGCRVSFDCNYRPSLWPDPQAAAQAFSEILPLVDVLFAAPGDLELVRGESPPGDDTLTQWRWAWSGFRSLGPYLQIMAGTHRTSEDGPALGALAADQDGCLYLEPRPLKPVVDRVGSGDAFAAGVLHGVVSRWPLRESLEFALKAAQVKHTIVGDQLRASEEDVLAMDGSVDIQR